MTYVTHIKNIIISRHNQYESSDVYIFFSIKPLKSCMHMKLAAPSTFQRLCSPMGLDVATLDSGALLPTVTLWILGFSGPTQTQMPPNRKLHVWQPVSCG